MIHIISILLTLILMINCASSESITQPLNSMSQSSNAVSSISKSVDYMSKSSDSLVSISKSIYSISASISGSSSKEEEKKDKKTMLYRMDIETLTSNYIKSSSKENYNNLINKVAFEHGIYNWEFEPNTYIGIGKGLKKANITKPEFEKVVTELAIDTQLLSYISRGYNEL